METHMYFITDNNFWPLYKVPGHRYYGDICECNNFDCGRDGNSKICSGKLLLYTYFFP